MSNTIYRIKREIAQLHPAYFGLPMATGIVSLASDFFGYETIAQGLFYINVPTFIFLVILYIIRMIFYTKNVIRDFYDGAKSPGFLTIVAGTNILGYQFLYFKNDIETASLLFYVGLILWVVLLYSIFTFIIIKREKISLHRGINGMWLLIIVATESVSVLSSVIYPYLNVPSKTTLFISLFMFLVGCVWYLIIITLIFYRLAFYKLKAIELAPAYWINMGAVAIVTLAGAALVKDGHSWIFIDRINDFILGLTFLFWSMGTWWIPLIIVLGIWRHTYEKIKLSYRPVFWSMVFPLGMYTACTFRLAEACEIDFLYIIPRYFVFIAIIAWSITALGLAGRIIRILKS